MVGGAVARPTDHNPQLESLLSKASDPAQRATLEQAVAAKRALLATAATDYSPRSGADTQGRPRTAPSPCEGTGQVSRLWEEAPVEMAMPAQGIRLVLDAEVALELARPTAVAAIQQIGKTLFHSK